jgi:hypothetical protein
MKEEQLAKIPAGKPVAKPTAVVKLPTPPATTSVPKPITTLAVDIGGTGIKAAVLDEKGKMITERQKIKTPHNATPKKVIAIIEELAKMAGEFDRASAGFPGVIKNGVVYTAVNLGKGWTGFKLEQALRKKLKVPVRIANDADVQGLGCVGNHARYRIWIGAVRRWASDSSRAGASSVSQRPYLRGRARYKGVPEKGQEEVEPASARSD